MTEVAEKSSDGANYGFLDLNPERKKVSMTSINSKQIFEISLDRYLALKIL